MDELYRKALQRRDELREELGAIDAFLARYSAIQERGTRSAKRSDTQMQLFEAGESRAKRAAAVSNMMDAVEEMVLAARRPLTRSALLQGLKERGIPVEGADKSKVLGTNIWRSKRFHNIKGIGYWPVSHPIPEPYRGLEKRSSMLLSE